MGIVLFIISWRRIFVQIIYTLRVRCFKVEHLLIIYHIQLAIHIKPSLRLDTPTDEASYLLFESSASPQLRSVCKTSCRVLDAPELADDFLLLLKSRRFMCLSLESTLAGHDLKSAAGLIMTQTMNLWLVYLMKANPLTSSKAEVRSMSRL